MKKPKKKYKFTLPESSTLPLPNEPIIIEATDKRQAYRLVVKKIGLKAQIYKDQTKDYAGQMFMFGKA